MKWEALALAVLTQTLQVGLCPRAEPTHPSLIVIAFASVGQWNLPSGLELAAL